MQTGSSPCLTAGERSKLLGILSRLESPFDGERAAAALLASRMLRAKNLQWDSLIAVPDVREAPTDRTLIQWRNDLSTCQRHLADLPDWPRVFTVGVARRKTSPTPAQREKLAEIVEWLRSRGLS